MRCVDKLLLGLILSLILISSVHAAVIAGVKVFHGGNFTSSIGGIFMAYGIDPYTVYNNNTDNLELYYRSVIISSTIDDTVNVRNGSCKSTKMYTYCYKGSMIDANNPKTYTSEEYLQPTMSITIESIPSPIATVILTRNTIMKVYCGELITVPITIKNSGTLSTNITYTETLPFNTLITTTDKGNVDGNIITFRDIVPDNTSRNYSYVMTNFDCISKNWTAKYTFTTYNETITRNLTNLSIVVQDAYRANSSLSLDKINSSLSINKTNNPDADVTYTWTITNLHPSIPLGLDISMGVPGAIITGASTELVRTGERSRYVGKLQVGNTLKLYLKFHEPDYGNYTVYTDGTVSINDHILNYTSNKMLNVLPSIVEAYMDVNTTKNNSLYVDVWAKNYDVTEKYYYIYGVIKGIGDEEPIYANSINPDSTILVAQKFYNTTGMGVKEINMAFDGIYRDKDSIEHPIHAEQLSIIINSPKIIHANATTNTTSANKTSTTSTTSNSKTSTTGATSKNTNTTGTGEPAVKKKDFITRVIEGLSNFLQSIFG